MKQTTLDQYAVIADEYFHDEGNKPFSVLELCNKLGVDHLTLKAWANGSKKKHRHFALSIYSRVGVSWEKGELSPSLATTLMRYYLNDAVPEGSEEQDMVIRILHEGV